MKRHLMQCMLGLWLGAASAYALADEHFTITRFQIEGNSILSTEQVQALVAPYTGSDRVYGDVQLALEALEAAYRQRGYTTVQVTVPEQELTGGVVKLLVVEHKIGKINVTGNKFFSEKNIRASLPALQSGAVPNLSAVSDAVQLSNENPAKHVDVTLESSTAETDTIDATVKVADSNPQRVLLSLDNTGTAATGRWRTGVALQDANLFGRDQTGTLAYQTSPDSPHGVNVAVYSLGYRIPLYSIGDSLDFIYGKSTTNTPASSPTLGGILGFTGKGDVYSMRWNHLFPRQGETASRLVFGVDYKKIDSRCTQSDGSVLSIAPPTPPVASCVPYTVAPLSVTYSSSRQGVGQNIDYSLGIERNWGTGTSYTNSTEDNRTDRYSYLTPGSRDTVDNFMVLHGSAAWLKALPKDWQLRLAGTLQYAPDPLVSAEQFGLVGASAVRGFNERAVATDSGAFVNIELYTPQLLDKEKGNLRLLSFLDYGRGYNDHVVDSGIASNVTVWSLGLGARYTLSRDFSVKLDVARVGAAGNSITEKRGDINAHVNAILGF